MTIMSKNILLAAATIAALAATGGCKSAADKSTADNAKENPGFEVKENIMSDARHYLTVADGDTAYLTLTTTVQWPEQLGDADIKMLQDSILGSLYGVRAPKDGIDGAISAFLANTADYQLGTVTEIDTIPDSANQLRSYYAARMGEIGEVTPRYITYRTLATQYMGGAHPLTDTYAFSYDLDSAKILNFDNMFLPGSSPEISKAIAAQLAEKFDVTPTTLTDAGFYTNEIAASRSISISDGTIVFHYNQYEIAPYSMGAFDVAIVPFTIRDYLTPLAKSILPTN